MALTFNWAQSNGAGNVVTDLGDTGNVANFKDADTTGLSDYATTPITASDTAGQGNSYEVWLRLHFTGTGTSISNVKFWKSTNFSPTTGITDKWGPSGSYATPVKTDSAIATNSIPTSTPGSANVPIAGNVANSITAFPGFTDYLVLQLHFGSTAAQGDSSLATYSVVYDET
jgi:hypothetical protein